MITDQRAYQRFDITAVLEFKLMDARDGTYAGITKNFSYDGVCLETQCLAFEPGDSLEVSLKHPHSDLTVSVPATVVWKRNAEKFAYLTGIKLGETELDTRFKMLEIMSAAGDVPVDSFVLGNSDDKRTGKEETEIPEDDFNALRIDETVPDASVTGDEYIMPEHHMDEGLSGEEEELITGKKSGTPFKEAFDAAAYAEGPEAEDMFNEEGKVSDMPWPKASTGKEKTDQIYDGITFFLNKVMRNRKFIYSSGAVVLAAVLIYAFFLIFKGPDESIKSPAPVPSQTAFPREEELNQPVPPVEDTPSDEVTAPGSQQEDAQQGPKEITTQETEQEIPPVSEQPPAIRTTDDQPPYIQVGAWKNPDNAREMLKKIKKYYPDAYLVAGKKFTRVKIPVEGETQGKEILKELEDRFNIKAILNLKR